MNARQAEPIVYRPISLVAKASIIALHLTGEPIRSIAKQIHCSSKTVKRTIASAGLDAIARDVRNRAVALTPMALEVVENKLRDNNLEAALTVLKGVGIFDQERGTTIFNVQVPAAEIARAREVVRHLRYQEADVIEVVPVPALPSTDETTVPIKDSTT